MTVKELIERLQKLPQDEPVFLSRDPEGNGFYDLTFVEESWYEVDDLQPVELSDYDDWCLETGQVSLDHGVFLWP